MKSIATVDDVSLAILRCGYKDKLTQPNQLDAKSIEELVSEAKHILKRTHKLTESVLTEGKNRVILGKCFDGCNTFDGAGKVYHAQINSTGEDLMVRLDDRQREERKHNQIIRVAKASAAISFISALAAIGSAWYAKVQSDYSALSARASAGSIATLPATPASTPKLPASTPATATHSATPTP